MRIQNIASPSPSFKPDHAAIRVIAKHLYGAKQRCGPRAKPHDRLHYRGVTYDLPPGLEGARLLYGRLGPIPVGELSPSEQFLPEGEKRKLLRQRGWSLDRIDSSGPYSLENIQYADAAAQTASRVIASIERKRRLTVKQTARILPRLGDD